MLIFTLAGLVINGNLTAEQADIILEKLKYELVPRTVTEMVQLIQTTIDETKVFTKTLK